MTINVTQEHISKGKRYAWECPIALALKDAICRWCGPNVGTNYIGFYDKSEIRHIVETPVAAQEFIRKFDNGKPVKPFSFEIPYQHEHSTAGQTVPKRG